MACRTKPTSQMKTPARKAARKLGLKHYFTGAACKRGHVCERYVSSARCIECAVNWCVENHERVAEKNARWHAKNRDRANAASARWHAKNRDRANAASADWHARHPEVHQKDSRKRRVMRTSQSYIEHVTPMPDGGRCPHCRVMMDGAWPAPNFPTLDHIKPLTGGGHHVPENTMMICLECNLIKGDRPLSFLLEKIALRYESPAISGRAPGRSVAR